MWRCRILRGRWERRYDEATWVLTSYLVSNAIVLPISGWIANRIGRKNFYMSCVALFTVFSFLCGLATSLPMLIVFRVIQGAAGGGLQPSERAILADTFPPEKRSVAFSLVWHGGGAGAGDWADGRRMDHGQLHVAMDLLSEYSGGDPVADFDEPDCGGPAVSEAGAGEAGEHRRDWAGAAGADDWGAADHARQGAGG